MYFLVKNILKNNYDHTLKHPRSEYNCVQLHYFFKNICLEKNIKLIFLIFSFFFNNFNMLMLEIKKTKKIILMYFQEKK